MLETAGFSVYEAVDGVDALCQLRTLLPTAIILDLMMPKLDGIGELRQIRDLEGPDAGTPIIALTANTMEGDWEALLTQGMDGYVAKPIDRRALLTALAENHRS